MKKSSIALFVLFFITFNSFGLLERSNAPTPLTPGTQNIEVSPRICLEKTCRCGARVLGPVALVAGIGKFFGR